MRMRGFTIIEFLMVALIVAIISVVIAQTLFQSYKTMQVSQDISDAQYQAWLGIQRISDDIHTIRSKNDLTTISSGVFAFTDSDGNSVQYQLSGQILTRNGINLATGIQSLSFGYLDSSGVSTAVPSAVRYVSIAITAQQGTASATFSTLVGTRFL